MKQKLIIPMTREDWEKLGEIRDKNNETICHYCDGELEKYTLQNGVIVYLCYKCDTVWKKEIIDENNFRLVKSEKLTII